ncbi:HmuY family protein [Leptospira sp. 2 VSF19]|uniref:HmuY family protein n=1 Tax=Leptospira soteropolitanensis TaxID=2950025 RepID=A0AAW5VCB5_9LEPT|nr:HmuY family protein [Leptospira soteropolitanensis]MCW7492510.1 HmuY family protein [Leptospira soteropolitanensis]MCW7500559.1 HmuY family protein [Leptospira soteropolitanensis]MCW7522771.1 HmuY family protein [Leptospira soteropolitanensis]MCW7526628.1 HmuY family protein [Leptospira soteropolitanensis]MCW7530529.1 HmuY family protein [Leptospira soteropolitanensis]
MKLLKTIFIGSFLFLIINCIPEKSSDDGSSAAMLLLVTEAVSASDGTTINASSTTNWVYVNLKANASIVGSGDAWDMRFKRYNIGTNSGTSGSGNGGACSTGSTDYLATYTGSECTKVVDVQLSSSGGGPISGSTESINPVISAPLDLDPMPAGYGTWYSYSNTILTAKPNVYIITGENGAKYVLQMLDYYNAAGTSGYPKFRWRKL